jgi:cellobiose-specific phosphotransferase system component IIA
MSSFEILELIKSAVTIMAGASTIGKHISEAREKAKEALNQAQSKALNEPVDLDDSVIQLAAAHARQLKSLAQQASKLLEDPRVTLPEREKELRRLSHEGLYQIKLLDKFLSAHEVSVEDLKGYFEAQLNQDGK